LVSAVVRRIEDRHELADARADLQQIANTLGSVITRRGSRNPVWQQYQHHFVGDRNRERFFAQLRSLTRRFASACLVIGKPEGKPDDNLDKAFPWNSSLLPRSIAPHVSRVVILHPGLLENFLPRFFVQASDFWAQKSTYRRAMLILDAVPRFGWSAEKHTKMLTELGALDPSGVSSEVETVKKFIRDLRRRHQKYRDEKAQRAA